MARGSNDNGGLLQALLKILQHARESGGQGSGQLLGFDNHEVLEVTEAFAYPGGELDEDEQEEYVDDMIKVLRDVNADNNTVGWYQSCHFDGFISYGLLEDQVMCQNRLPNSILLAVDLVRSANGPPALHALRLREGFQALYRERKAGAAGTLPTVAALAEDGLFEELPVFVRISALERILLLQQHRDGQLPVVGTPSIVELEQLLLKDAATDLTRAVDEVLGEAGRMQHYLRTTSKQQQALNAQLMRLKHENAQRTQSGEETLPLSSVTANFRPPAEPTRIPCLVASSNLNFMLKGYRSCPAEEDRSAASAK